MSDADLLQQLMDAMRCLPGVGPKTAQRMSLHLLERDRQGGEHLSRVLKDALARIGRCEWCRNLTEHPRCNICSNANREQSQLCIVETPADVLAIEQATSYRGRYFVLLGRLSPLDGIGPEDIGLDQLSAHFAAEPLAEVIVATNPTVEGEATAYYIQQLAARHQIKVSRIAHGVPLGGELEYIDAGTLAHAFGSRQPVE